MFVRVAVLHLVLAIASTAPSTQPTKEEIGFLSRYGYIDAGAGDAQELLSGDGLSKNRLIAALKEVQRFGSLPQTGLLDQNTRELMLSKRCGLPDVVKGGTEIITTPDDESDEKGDEEHYNETPLVPSNRHFHHHNHSKDFHNAHHHHHFHHHNHGDEFNHKNGSNEKIRRKRYILASRGWDKRNLKYHLANWPPALHPEEVLNTMESALDAWATHGGLRFTKASDSADADITFGFYGGHHGDMYPFDGPGSVLAHAFFPGSSQYEGDIHFDADEEWKINSNPYERGVDLYHVTLHELGHSLGLSHSPEDDSIMYPYYRGTKKQLGEDDIRAMHVLYRNYDTRYRTTTRAPYRRPSPTTERTTTTSTDRPQSRPDKPRRPEGGGSWGGPRPSMGCSGEFDVVAIMRNELFIIKDKWLWRLWGPGQVQPTYPVDFHRFFYQLPKTIKKIDAIYQRERDSKILIFTGRKYWVFDGSDIERPRSITDFGLPRHLEKVDAATSRNGTAILFTGDKYWLYDEDKKELKKESPRDIQDWQLFGPIDAALTYTNGDTFFFKGDSFWVYDERSRSLRQHHSRKQASEYWLGC